MVENFIIDSRKGVMIDKTWLHKESGAINDERSDASDDRYLDYMEVGELAHWINTQCRSLPGTAEDNFVYWSSIRKENIYLANLSALMAGANLHERSLNGTHKTHIVDSLFHALKHLDKTTTRRTASKCATGITRFYGVVLQCGEDAVFNCKFSIRHFRNMSEMKSN